MIDVLPIKLITPTDAPIFGSLAVNLGKLSQIGFPVAPSVAVAPLEFKLRTILEHYDFGSKEIFEQSLSLVRREIYSQPIPEILKKEIKGQKQFLLNGQKIKKDLWKSLLEIWIEEIKKRLWRDGFYPGITQGLTAQIVVFIKKIESSGMAFFDQITDDTVINITAGKVHPNDLKKIHEIVLSGNKKLFLPFEYEWIVDGHLKLVGLKSYTPRMSIQTHTRFGLRRQAGIKTVKSAVKVFLDLSSGLVIETEVDGVYISTEKIFDLNKPQESFENLVFKIVEASLTFPDSPILVKLADKSEGMGKVRGALRLLHQKSLFDPIVDAINFARVKRGLNNIHIVVPYVRGAGEFLQIKKRLSSKVWLEVCVPENIINLEDYLQTEGIILNLDELISHINGFDNTQQEVGFYKNDIKGLLKFLEDGLKILHKAKVPFIAYGSLNLYPEVLEFLIEKGVYGVVVEKYEAHSAHELMRQAERRVILRSNPIGR